MGIPPFFPPYFFPVSSILKSVPRLEFENMTFFGSTFLVSIFVFSQTIHVFSQTIQSCTKPQVTDSSSYYISSLFIRPQFNVRVCMSCSGGTSNSVFSCCYLFASHHVERCPYLCIYGIPREKFNFFTVTFALLKTEGLISLLLSLIHI